MNFKRGSVLAISIILITVCLWQIYQYLAQQNAIDMRLQRLPEEQLSEQSEMEGEQTEEVPTAEELLERNPDLAKIKQLQEASHSAILFYGQIVDQYGQPVPDAEVRYSYTHYNTSILPAASWSTPRGQVATDTNGKFVIKNIEGIFLSLESVGKPGYEIRPASELGYIVFTPRDAGEKRHVPESSNPVIIHAWKKNEAARKLIDGAGFITPIVGEPRRIKFPETRETVAITFTHHDTAAADGRGGRQWSARLTVDNGGLVESADIFMYEAPEAGYQPKWEITAGENEWIKKKFYLRALDGKIYGRIEVEMTGYYGQDESRGAADIKYWINPTGSRNLLPADE